MDQNSELENADRRLTEARDHLLDAKRAMTEAVIHWNEVATRHSTAASEAVLAKRLQLVDQLLDSLTGRNPPAGIMNLEPGWKLVHPATPE